MTALRSVLATLLLSVWTLGLPACSSGRPPGGGSECTEQSDCTTAGTVCLEGFCRVLCNSCSICDPAESCQNGVCLPAETPQCTSHGQCNTPASTCKTSQGVCCAGTCSYADLANGTTCNQSNNPSGSLDGICAAGTCVPPDFTCTDNAQCSPKVCRLPTVGAVDRRCVDAGGNGAPCDPADTAADCVSGLSCRSATALCQPTSGSCSANAECAFTCLGGQCQGLAGSLGTCDPNDSEDCTQDYTCVSTTCKPANGSSCTNANDGSNDCASNYCVCANAPCTERKCRTIECKCQYKVDNGPSCDGNVDANAEAYVNQCPATGAACDGAGGCQAACTDCCATDTDCQPLSPRKCECVNDYCSAKKCRLGDCAPCRYNISDATTCDGFILPDFNDAHSTCTTGGCDGVGNCQKPNGVACTADAQCQSEICACGLCSATVGLGMTRYDVAGGGTYCSPATGLELRLTGSDVGAAYQLKCNGDDSGSPVSGTGGALSFGVKPVCSAYTVLGTQTGKCATLMNGSATVIAGLALNSSFTLNGGGPYCEGSSGAVVRLSGSETGVSYKLQCTSPSADRATVAGTGSQISFGAQSDCAGFTVEATRSGYCTAAIAGGAITVTSIAQLGSCGTAGHCCGGACDESTTILGANADEDCEVNPGVLTCVGQRYGYELKALNSQCGVFPAVCDIPENDCSSTMTSFCSTPRACTGHNVVGKCSNVGKCNPTVDTASSNPAACYGIRCANCKFCSSTGGCDVVPAMGGANSTTLVCANDGGSPATCQCCKGTTGNCLLLTCDCSPACSGNVPEPCNRYPPAAIP